jgi:hypothetical protein
VKTVVKRVSNNSNNIIDSTKIIRNAKTQLPYPKDIDYLKNIFNNEKMHVVSTLITGNGLLYCVLYDESESIRKFYYIFLEIDITSFKSIYMPDRKINIEEVNKDKLYECNIHSEYYYYIMNVRPKETFMSRLSMINILVVKEFTPGDKIFSILGNECVYKMYSNMHTLFNKSDLTLTYNDATSVNIPSPYKFVLLSLINKFMSISNLLQRILAKPITTTNVENYYRIKRPEGEEYATDGNIDELQAFINYELTIDKRNDTLFVDIEKPFPNNNFFVSAGKNYIVIMNKYYEDIPKSDYLPKIKQQMNASFKYTTWVITREYAKQCLEIMKQLSDNPSNNNFQEIHKDIKNNVLFNITSLKNGENIEELKNHINSHSNFIKRFIITKDKYNCKAFEPQIIINNLSDISSSILHIHFNQNIIHSHSIRIINFKRELFTKQLSIYTLFELGIYFMNKPINKLLTNSDALFNKSLNSPYSVALKISGLLTL